MYELSLTMIGGKCGILYVVWIAPESVEQTDCFQYSKCFVA